MLVSASVPPAVGKTAFDLAALCLPPGCGGQGRSQSANEGLFEGTVVQRGAGVAHSVQGLLQRQLSLVLAQ